jgi:hypothetical protein
MSLKYTHIRNNLNDRGYYPRVVQSEKISTQELVEDLSQNTALDIWDINLILQKLPSALLKHLRQGRVINTPIGTFRLSARGVLLGAKDTFSPKSNPNHHLALQFFPSSELVGDLNETTDIEEVRPTSKTPVMMELIRLEKGGMDHYCPGEVLELRGHNLKINRDRGDEGVFLLDSDGLPYPVDSILISEAKSVLFKLPDVPSGAYLLELRSRGRGQKLLIGEWEDPLSNQEG